MTTNVPAKNGKTRTLEECEANIERHLKSFWEMAEEYRYIRDNKLYRKNHQSWETYCKDRWGLSKTTVNTTIRAADVRASLAAQNGQDPDRVLPQVTDQAAALLVVPDEDERAEVWQEAVRRRGGAAPSSITVKEVIKDRRNGATPAPREPTPIQLARTKMRAVETAGTDFKTAVNELVACIDDLESEDAQRAAYAIVETVHVVIGALQDGGYLPEQVARVVTGGANVGS